MYKLVVVVVEVYDASKETVQEKGYNKYSVRTYCSSERRRPEFLS